VELYGIDASPGKQDFAAQFFMADLPQTAPFLPPTATNSERVFQRFT
jgi:hypothetical protein